MSIVPPVSISNGEVILLLMLTSVRIIFAFTSPLIFIVLSVNSLPSPLMLKFPSEFIVSNLFLNSQPSPESPSSRVLKLIIVGFSGGSGLPGSGTPGTVTSSVLIISSEYSRLKILLFIT